MEVNNFYTGAQRDVEDERDIQWQEVGFSAAPFDWSVGYDVENELRQKLNDPDFRIPVKDQGQSYSCGGQAWAYYDSVFEAMGTGTYEERSAKFIYAQTAVESGGSKGRDNSEIVSKQGVAREVILPSYQGGNAPTEAFMVKSSDITSEVRADAKKARAKGYANVSADIDAMAQAIQANYGMVIGVDGENNGTWRSLFPKPPFGKDTWGHWLYAGKAKLIEDKKYIGVLNSWGKNTGDDGWQWLSEDYFKSGHIWYGWTQVFDPSSADAAFYHRFTSQMDFGDIGAEVSALQTALKHDGCMASFIPSTGFFGPLTRSSVQKFQKKYGIASSGTPKTTGYGRVGKKTLSKLNELFGAAA